MTNKEKRIITAETQIAAILTQLEGEIRQTVSHVKVVNYLDGRFQVEILTTGRRVRRKGVAHA